MNIRTPKKPAVYAGHFNGTGAANHGGLVGAITTRRQAHAHAKAEKQSSLARSSVVKRNVRALHLSQACGATSSTDVRDQPLGRQEFHRIRAVTIVFEVLVGLAFGYAVVGGIDLRRVDTLDLILKLVQIVGFGGALALLCVLPAETLALVIGHFYARARGRTAEHEDLRDKPAWRHVVACTIWLVSGSVIYLMWEGNGARAAILSTESQTLSPTVMSALAVAIAIGFAGVGIFYYSWPAAVRLATLAHERDVIGDRAAKQLAKAYALRTRWVHVANGIVVKIALADSNPTAGVLQRETLPDSVPETASGLLNLLTIGGHQFDLSLSDLEDIEDPPLIYSDGVAASEFEPSSRP